LCRGVVVAGFSVGEQVAEQRAKSLFAENPGHVPDSRVVAAAAIIGKNDQGGRFFGHLKIRKQKDAACGDPYAFADLTSWIGLD
jgi:hypothetical protein